MWLAILGPLLVHDGETQVAVPEGRRRVLLAALVLHAGKPVSADALTEVVWDGIPPSGAVVTLRSHVLRLRRALGPRAGLRLVTRYPGYLLQAGEDEVDLLRFRRLCEAGAAAARAGAWGRAEALLGEALDLWRGMPLADIPSESLRRDEVQALEALRLQAEEWRIDAALHLGRHAELVPGLQSLAARHPLREGFHAQLMLALYRCGRQAEALAAYQCARDVLLAELGTEPGPSLRDLHQRVLSADPSLAGTGPAWPTAAAPQPDTPRELPPAVPDFTGRSAELRTLTRLLDRSGEQAPGAVVISAIGGTAGVGKTALAVHWAHRVVGRFPDGQLYVNLRGYDPGQPLPAADALAGFLRSLGVPSHGIPAEENERAARYRSLLAGKQMLIVLDNAGSADQVRPLLPGTPGCTVVVTSRDALAGLVIRDGATRLDLDVLPPEEAVALLRTLIGARADAEPAAAAELAGQCCRLPLALRVAAELAASRPAMSLAMLAGELADLRSRLDLLAAGGDPRTEVRAVFSWSYRHLDAATARTFRLLGLHPGPDVEPYAAAALTGVTGPQARRALEVLARACLIQPAGPDRYGMHDLLRGYARELTTTEDSRQEQHAALTRLFDHYLHTATTALDALFPADRQRRPSSPPARTAAPLVSDPAAARGWLDAQRVTLVAVIAHTAGNDWPDHATRLAAALASYLQIGDYYPEAVTIHTCACQAARRTGDRAAEATALSDLGLVNCQQSRFDQAARHQQQARAIFQEIGDPAGEGRAVGRLGLAECSLGHPKQAASHLRQSLALLRETGDRFGEAHALEALGWTDMMLGRFPQATRHLQQSLTLCREINDVEGEGAALTRLGNVELRLGRYRQAASNFMHALALSRETGERAGEAAAFNGLGTVDLQLGHYRRAAHRLQQAVDLWHEIGNRTCEAEALNGLGDVLSRAGEADKARAHHASALRLASEAGSPLEQARAHSGLARAHQADANSVQARHHWQEALTRYAAIGAPEADEIRGRLAEIGDDGDDGHKPADENAGVTVSSPHYLCGGDLASSPGMVSSAAGRVAGSLSETRGAA